LPINSVTSFAILMVISPRKIVLKTKQRSGQRQNAVL
jgi:hypothetical protein